MTPGLDKLIKLGACPAAVEWAASYRGKPAELAWRECERGDWLLWLAAMVGVDRKLVVLAACDSARTALRHVPEGEKRPLRAIETAEAWCRGEATIKEVRAAAHAAYAAAYAAAADAAYAAAHAAYAASHAAYAASHAAYAAAHAAYAAAHAAAADAADAAYAASADADAADARAAALKASADLVRARIPWDAVREAVWR